MLTQDAGPPDCDDVGEQALVGIVKRSGFGGPILHKGSSLEGQGIGILPYSYPLRQNDYLTLLVHVWVQDRWLATTAIIYSAAWS